MLMGPVKLLFLLFLIAARTCSVVMFICVGCRLSTFLVCVELSTMSSCTVLYKLCWQCVCWSERKRTLCLL